VDVVEVLHAAGHIIPVNANEWFNAKVNWPSWDPCSWYYV